MKDNKVIQREKIYNKNISTTRYDKKFYSFKSIGKNKIRKKKKSLAIKDIITKETKVDNLLPVNTVYKSNEENILEQKILDNNGTKNDSKPKSKIKKESKSLFEKLKCEYLIQ